MQELKYTIGSTKKLFKNLVRRTAWFNIIGLDDKLKSILAMKYKGLISKDPNKNEISFPLTNPTNYDHDGTQNFIKALEYIKQNTDIKIPDIDVLLEEAETVRNDIATKKDIENAEKSTDELWLTFMKEIEKPEIQQLLKSIGQYNNLDDSVFGWQLSLNNIMRIKSQKPDATFLQTRSQWRNKYNREVTPDAVRILIVAPKDINRDNENSTRQNFMKQVGYNNDTTFDSLSHQQKDFVDISLRHANNAQFHYITVFDVSDTVVMEGAEDTWTNEVGFDNNLTASLNQKAKDFQSTNSNISQDDAKKLYNNEGNLVELNEILTDIMVNDYKFSANEIPNHNSNLATNYKQKLDILTNFLIEKKGKIVKQENRDLSVRIATTIILCLTNVSPEIVAKRLANNELTNESYFDLRNIINDIIVKINKRIKAKRNKTFESKILFEIQEFPILNSVDDLLKMIGIKKYDANDLESINDNKKIFYNIFRKLI